MDKLIAFVFILISVAATSAIQKPQDTSSAEEVLRELKEEISLWREELEKTRVTVADYNIYCVDLGLELAFSALGPIMPLMFPTVRIVWGTFEYLSCLVHLGHSHPQCRSQLETVLGFAKGLPAELLEFSKNYAQVIAEIPAAVSKCIHSIE